MCNILMLRTGVMPKNKDEFWNMCYNNWHSFGMSYLKDGKLVHIKFVPDQSGDTPEIDPQEVWDTVEKFRKYPRLLHVRHTTAGLTNEENCHPFTVFKDSEVEVVFAHNGTMHEYVSKVVNEHGVSVKDDSGVSDTVNFMDRVVCPVLRSWVSKEGFGDLSDKLLIKTLDNFWPMNNRGILFDNKSRFVTFGVWKIMKGVTPTGDLVDIPSANDEYFSTCKRGPEFSRRAVAEVLKREKEKKQGTLALNGPVVKEKSVLDFFPIGSIHSFMSLSEDSPQVVKQIDFDDRDHLAALGYMTAQEIGKIAESPADAFLVLDAVLPEFTKLLSDFDELEEFYDRDVERVNEKHEKATKVIATMANQIADLKAQVAALQSGDE